MTDITFTDDCGECGHHIRLVFPPTRDACNNPELWARCAECQHINPVTKRLDET